MKWSFLPPFAGSKRTRWQAGLLAYGIIRPTRHAFPFDVNSGLRVAFVADYSCEGSGGFAPRFPNTCGVSGCQCGLNEALVCFNVDCHYRHNSEPSAHDPQSAGFCKDSNKRRFEEMARFQSIYSGLESRVQFGAICLIALFMDSYDQESN
jgi:hypothetical protein